MSGIRKNTRIRLIDDEETTKIYSQNEIYNEVYDEGLYEEDTHDENLYEENLTLGNNTTRVSRKVKNSRRGKEPLDKRKRAGLLILLLLICSLVGWFIGLAIANGENKITLGDDSNLPDQEATLSAEVNKICNYLVSGDTSKIQDRFVIGETKASITKEEAKALADYFKDDEDDRNIKAFSSRLKSQVSGYLKDTLKTEDKYFYLSDKDNKLCIAINKPSLKLLVKTSQDVNVKANGTEVSVKDGKVEIPSVFPVKILVEATYGEETNSEEIDLLKDFLVGNSYTGSVTKLILKHGVGLKATILSNAPEGEVYLNGNKTDLTLEDGIAHIDGLKEGDTIRVKYKDKMSKEEKIKDENTTLEFEFDLEELATRFNLPKTLVDNLENKAKVFLNSIGNAVGNQNAGAVIGGVQMSSNIQNKVSNRLTALISNYNSLVFSNITVTNATQGGDNYTLTLSYSFDTIGKTGQQEIANGSSWVKFSLSGEVIDFSL